MIIENQEIFDISRIKYRKANHADMNLIQMIEKESFGINIHEYELKEILDGKGIIYLAMKENQPIAYLVILKENIDEHSLQAKLHSMHCNGIDVMHDDTHIHKEKQLYWHLIGVHHNYQGKGIGSKLIQYVKSKLSPQENALEWTACIRVNNLRSMLIFMKYLGMSMVSRKSKDKRQFSSEEIEIFAMHGSRETNFNASNRIAPAFNLEDKRNKAYLWKDQKLNGEPKEILIPIWDGEESDLPLSTIKKIDEIMSFDNETPKYICRGIFKTSKVDWDESFLYFTKEETQVVDLCS